jgi:uncharacterized protein (DUF488 family)
MEVFSIGHSTLEFAAFVAALRKCRINAIADVRSSPYSRHYPQYNREELKNALQVEGIAYVFLGKELGGRPKDQALYTKGIADYEKMAASDSYKEGIERLERGAHKYRLAIMCSERSPLDCHRCLLVSRTLWEHNISVNHIVPGGQNISQKQVESELLTQVNKVEADMFESTESRLDQAYRDRAQKVAYAERPDQSKSTAAE